MPPRTSTTRLPAALREQIDKDADQNTRKRHKPLANRKEARKQARQEQKQRKAEFFSQAKTVTSQSRLKRPASHQPQDEPLKKKARQQPQPMKNDKTEETVSLPSKQSIKEINKLSARKGRVLLEPRSRSQGGDPEDAHIAWLEAQLAVGSNKSGKRKSATFDDGLDDLMMDLDRIIPSFGQLPSKKPGSVVEDGSVQTLDEDADEDEESEASGNDISEFEGFSSYEGDEVEPREDSPMPTINNHLISTDGDVPASLPSGSRYVPPHLRAAPTEDAERLMALTRQMNGLLNRLSEQNIASIIASFEELYRKHPRNDVSSTLTKLIIDGISSHSSHLDAFVVLHASLVASLHKIIGVGFAGPFIQSLIEAYEQQYCALRSDDILAMADEQKGKECLNLVVLLSELYNFQVVSCVLLYDVLRGLLDKLDEFDVELLLKIVRISGQQLRQDDPSALKDIVELVQEKMTSKDKATISSRTNFMIETLTNLKNNKSKRSVNPDGHAESVDRMKKFLSGLARRHHGMAHEPLRVTLDDLHSADKKGKWWIVGAAWSGDPLVDRARTEDQILRTQAVQAADSLVKLARKQGMNTDVRRSIFVVLMSSDDYFDACERLSQLNLTEIQQREIVRVILHCLGNEKAYNPYYTLVVQQLCQTSHSYKITLQFCLWDFLRDLGENSVGGAEIVKDLQNQDLYVNERVSPTKKTNIARAYAWWIAKGFCQLTILKPVDFTTLRQQTIDFFHILFSQLFISSQVLSPAISLDANAATFLADTRDRQAVEEVFIKVKRLPILTQGLVFFLNMALWRDNGPDNEVVFRTIKWARDIAIEALHSEIHAAASLD
ncbi:hypothetical protein BU17DRAFT_74234 [Hysterangium stoloniferum]|nr:hypothetical protein BU17DRAFT_74234 [Hysterangium stoloniferum]